MIHKTITITFLLCYSMVYSQSITLGEVLKMAKSEKFNQSELKLSASELEVSIQKSKRLPLLYGDANLQRNLIVPVTPVPAIAFDPNAFPGEITPLRFATDWSAKAGLQFSLDVYNPQNHAQILEAKINQRKAGVEQEDAANEFKNNIINLYAQVALAQEQLEVAKQLEADFKQTLQILDKRYVAGRVTEVERNTALIKALDLHQLVEEAHLVLNNKKMALWPYITVDLQTNFSTTINELMELKKINTTGADIETLALDKEWSALKIKNIDYQAIPKLTINGYYGSQFFNNDFKVFDSNYWYGSSFVNLTLRVPISETYERSLQKQKLKKEASITSSKYEQAVKEKEVSDLQLINERTSLNLKIATVQRQLNLLIQNAKLVKAQVDAGTQLIKEYNVQIENVLNQQKILWQTQYELIQKNLE